MICAVGRCPKTQAQKPIEVMCDFKDRGGTLIIRRRNLPATHCSSASPMTSMCQFGTYCVPGLSSWNPLSIKATKSRRKNGSNSWLVILICFSYVAAALSLQDPLHDPEIVL